MAAAEGISIIMPVYNAAPWLEAAACSVLGQQGFGTPLELLLVDDGSTDGSAALCDRLAGQDARVRVLHQENAGISAARNAGLALAKGRYIGFCDDDDAFLPGFLAKALDLAQNTGADVVRMDYRLLHEGADGALRELAHAPGAPLALRTRAGGLAYAAFLRTAGPMFVWNALYRREVLAGIRFDESCRSGLEDFVFNAQVHQKAGLMVYEPQAAYLHNERRSGASSAASAVALQARVRALRPWMAAEYAAAGRWCASDDKVLRAVWNERKAGAVTFLMHQLRDNAAPKALRRQAWRALRAILAQFPHGPLDFWLVAGKNTKQQAALFLYGAHLQGLYGLLPNNN